MASFEVNHLKVRVQMTGSIGMAKILVDLIFILERMRIVRACYEVPRNKFVTGFGTRIVRTCHEVRNRKIHIAIAQTCYEHVTNLVRT